MSDLQVRRRALEVRGMTRRRRTTLERSRGARWAGAGIGRLCEGTKEPAKRSQTFALGLREGCTAELTENFIVTFEMLFKL